MTHKTTPTGTIPGAAGPERLLFLDWLRILAFGLLVLYHVGMYYVSWHWHVKSPASGPALEPWMLLSSPWRMSLLFLLSGAATSLMLRRDDSAPWLGERSRRLLLPLLCGMALVVPPQAYFEVVDRHGYAGHYLAFLSLYFTAHSGFCDARGCLILPTWNHLWFLAYLWVYTLVLWASVRLFPGWPQRAAQAVLRHGTGAGLLAWPVLVLAAWRITLSDRFPPTGALVDDWLSHAAFGSVFVAGVVLARAPAMWERMTALRLPALTLALSGWLVLLAVRAYGGDVLPEPAVLPMRRLAYALVQWSAVVAAVGYARRYLNVDHRWRRYLCEAVFPVYVLHQTVIIVLTRLSARWQWSPLIEGPVLVMATLALCLAGYELVRRVRYLRPWFGLQGRRARGYIVPPRPSGVANQRGPIS